MLTNLLRKLLNYYTRKEVQEIYLERKAKLETFFHEFLPDFDEKWHAKTIIQNGSFNYFLLPSQNLPKYDFVLPEIPLYVVLGDIRSASWEFVCNYGISRSDWEKYQHDLIALEEGTKNLPTIGMSVNPKVLILKWTDSLNFLSLLKEIDTNEV